MELYRIRRKFVKAIENACARTHKYTRWLFLERNRHERDFNRSRFNLFALLPLSLFRTPLLPVLGLSSRIRSPRVFFAAPVEALGKVQSKVLPVTLRDELASVLRARFCITLHRPPLCPRQPDAVRYPGALARCRKRGYPRVLQKHHRIFKGLGEALAPRVPFSFLEAFPSAPPVPSASHSLFLPPRNPQRIPRDISHRIAGITAIPQPL